MTRLSAEQERALDAQILAEDYIRKLPPAPLITVRGKPPVVTRYKMQMPWNEDCAMKLYLCPRLAELRKQWKRK